MTTQTAEGTDKVRGIPLATQILTGLALGVATGLFLGELGAALNLVEGKTKQVEPPRWSIVRDVLGWID